MAEPKFTPGPWHASRLVEGAICTEANRRENLLGLDAEGYAVFMNKHDAVIASAAPDTYEALERIMSELPTRRDWLDPVTERMAKAALAKARGEAQ